MQSFTRLAVSGLVVMLAVGCASTKVTDRHRLMETEKIAKPDRIYVYPFAPTHEDIPSWSTAAEKYAKPSKPLTPEELEVGRKLGALVAKELVTEINEMGVLALEGNEQSLPQLNDLMIIGYFEGVEEGSTVKRLGLGFGSGAAELRTAVEGYQMTNTGPRLLGTGKLDSGGGKMPGLIAPIAVLAATANPIGLIVMGTAKVEGEITGRTKIEGAAKRTAEAIGKELRIRFKEKGLIK
ncbi:DUF4410 domain-containing protein [Nitrospira sp. T9]|uniref:DUF4410 domain-containing protein n=1 Tax=unclassified Nitrospira TaxID=2652172 RepID=UPI003F987CF9